MSEANQRRTQVAESQATGAEETPASTTVRLTAEPTESTTNVAGTRPDPTEEPDETPTPNAAATEEAEIAAEEAEVAAAEEAAAEEAAAAQQAAAEEEAAAAEAEAAEAAEATQLAVDESLLTLSFSPTTGIYLTVIGDGTVIFDGNVAAGTTEGPFNATSFEIYTSDPTSTNINNLDTGATFYMGSNSFSLP